MGVLAENEESGFALLGWININQNKQAINLDKPLLEVSHTDYSEDTDEPNSALLLEV